MARGTHKSVKLFCSYSHKDETHLEILRDWLAPLERTGLIEEWHDREILPGQEWAEAIDENLKTSEIVLLLVTPAFVRSDYCYEKEMTQALERHERGEARVIPIIVRPADWECAPFGKLQALPKDAKPITTWSNQDEAWYDVNRGIRKAVKELLLEQEQAAKERYRKAVAEAWTDRKLDEAAADQLNALINELDVNTDTAADIEREIMGDTKETLLERQIRDREAEERRNRLNELYARARRSHQAQEWQAVVDIFEQIRTLDPGCSDSEGLLASARKALEQARRTATIYDQGLRHMEAKQWPEALECFEEVQRLEPGYQETERLLSRVRRELVSDRIEREQWDEFTDRTEHLESRSTSPWEYLDLELEIREGDRRTYPVVVHSARGEEVREEMQFPFDEGELEDKLGDLEKAVLLSGTRRRRIRSPERQTVQDFGQTLFQALLCGEVGAYYEESLRKARLQNKGLRLKLRIQPPELATLPWEFLYDPDRNAYLCLSSKTPLVRYVDLHEPVEQLTVTPPLRILGMVASPRDLPGLEVEEEKQRVEEAIGDLQAEGRVELTWLEGQTSRDLMRAMRHGPWHVFHFIGHGDFDPDSKEGLIVLADEDGNKRFLRAEDLAYLLKDHWDLRLVLLNSCGGAMGSEHDAFSSTAATLVRPGIPAVLAMQYEISDAAAVEFSRSFYEAVADGLPLDAAVAGARTSLKIELGDTLEWGTPVLYMRSADGRIFDVQERKKDSLSRYRERVESAWVDGELREHQVEWLSDYANDELELGPNLAAEIEREVMGDTKEAVLERQIRDREAEERRNRLNELYARARRSHQAQEWQAVVDIFEQIRTLDPEYSDSEGLLASAREELAALEHARRVAASYDQGRRHMEAGRWAQALKYFQEVQRLEPGYQQIQTLLSRARNALQGGRGLPPKPDSLPGSQGSKPDFLPGEQEPGSDKPPGLPD